jgi:hypothetical protein
MSIIDTCKNHHHPGIAQTGPALLSGMVGFCTSGTFLTQGFTWPLYILMALTIALTHYLQQERTAS